MIYGWKMNQNKEVKKVKKKREWELKREESGKK